MTAPTKSHAQVLREARALIEDKKHWTTRAYARARNGRVISPIAENAVRWCAYGAADKVTKGAQPKGIVRLLEAAALELFTLEDIIDVNDKLGHDAVLAMYDEAIRLADETEGGQP